MDTQGGRRRRRRGGGGGGGRGDGEGGSSRGGVRSAASESCENTGGGGRGGVAPTTAFAATGPGIDTGGGGVTQPSAASGPLMNTGGGPKVAPLPLINADGGGAPGGGGAGEDNGFVPLTIPTALFLRPYKPRAVIAPRLPPLKREDAKIVVPSRDPMEFSRLRLENSVLRGPRLQAFMDTANFYSEGITLKEYFTQALQKVQGQDGNGLLRKVRLPNTNAVRVKMRDEACAVIWSWVCLFTRNHVANRSWNGLFNLESFILLHGQVHAVKPPNRRLATHGERLNDLEELSRLIWNILVLDGQRPAYLAHFIKKLKGIKPGPLLESYRLGLESHFFLLTSMGQSNVLYQVKIKFDCHGNSERGEFVKVLQLCNLPVGWLRRLESTSIFQDIIKWGENQEARSDGTGIATSLYTETVLSAFILNRNYNTHVSGNSVDATGKQLFNVDGAQLLVPEEFGDFLADMWFNMLDNKFNINLGFEDIARNCMPSSNQVLYKRVENMNASFVQVQAGDDKTSQAKETEVNAGTENRENTMTYDDLLRRNKQLERSAQISVLLSKHLRDKCARDGSDIPKEVIEMELLKDEIGLRSCEEETRSL